MSTALAAKPMSHTAPALPDVKLLRLEIAVRWSRPYEIPAPVVSNVLRGALGITLRRLVCPPEWLDNPCAPCPLYEACAYGRVFMPTPPPDATQLRLQQDLPRPFVIEPHCHENGTGSDQDDRCLSHFRGFRVMPGMTDCPLSLANSDAQTDAALLSESRLNAPAALCPANGLRFRLMLFGTAIERLPFFIATLDRLGHDGMGRERVPFTIESVHALHPAGEEELFAADSTTLRLPTRTITIADLIGTAKMEDRGWRIEDRGAEPAAPADRPQPGHPPSSILHPQFSKLRLRFLTPTLLKTGSRIDERGRRIPAAEVRERPPLGVIVRRLRDRLSALCLFFGERWETDFAAWGALADEARLIDSRTEWLTRRRRSTRTGESHETSGFVGEATYEFPNPTTRDTLLPLLRIGEAIHVGKHAPWGNGGYEVAMVKREQS